MKKVISILLLCSFMLLSFASCVSKEERQQIEKNEKKAKSILERYIDENYEGALIEDIECLKRTSNGLFGADIDVTDCVKAKISYNESTVNVVVDLETGTFYTDYNKQKIVDDIERLVLEEISVQNPKDIEIELVQYEVNRSVDGGWDYYEADIDSAEELLKTGRHGICVLCKYADSQMDFESIPVKSLFKDEYKSEIRIAFVNYRDTTRYDYGKVLDSGFCDLSVLFKDEQDYYNVSEIKLASQTNEKKEQSDGKTTKELVYEEDYKHYNVQTVNGVEFAWNDAYYDIEFSETIADDVVDSEDYDDCLFYAVREDAIKLSCTKITDKELDYSSRIYIYYPRDILDFDFDKEYYIINLSPEKPVVSKKFHQIMSDYYYDYWRLEDNFYDYTLGFYEKVEIEQESTDTVNTTNAVNMANIVSGEGHKKILL